jgi:hypothetical protein
MFDFLFSKNKDLKNFGPIEIPKFSSGDIKPSKKELAYKKKRKAKNKQARASRRINRQRKK